MTDEELLKLANKDGFPTQFKQYREFLSLKLSALELLRVERSKVDENKDPEGFEMYLEFSKEINGIIKDEEEKFIAQNGDVLNQLMTWVEANPK